MEQDSRDLQLPTPFETFMVIIMSFFISLIPSVLLLAITSPPEGEALHPTTTKVALVLGELTLIVLPLLYLRRHNLPVARVFRWQKVPSHILWISALIGICLTLLIEEINRIFQTFIPMPEDFARELAKMLEINTPLDFVLVILSAIILASLVEEVIFRGFLQQSLEQHISVTQGVIYASIAWAIVHSSLYLMVQIFLFGFILGYLAWRTNSIFPAAICHAINNGISVLLLNWEGDGPIPVYEWGNHVSPILLIPAAYLGYKGIQYIDAYYRALSSSNNSSSR